MSPKPNQKLNLSLAKTADFIAATQTASGAIPWFADGIVDPWDHVEAVMGLSVAGYFDAAKQGLTWLQKQQEDSGFWHAAYQNGDIADDQRAETNFVAYPATGVWHYYLASGDKDALTEFWPMVERALDWVLALQTEHGEIYWAVDKDKGISRDALVTGCSSIYKSLECGARIQQVLGMDSSRYLQARRALGDALRHKPERFDRTWPSKARYSMDWFYPVLTGVFRDQAATDRLDDARERFVVPNLGCKCVEEEPWVTMAETCELIMALQSANQAHEASTLFQDLARFQLEDGSWWTGYVYTDDVHWPDERPTWTAGAILLAADALCSISAASHLFLDHLPE